MTALDPFEQTQKAVDIVNTSPHPANKIAATIFGSDKDRGAFSFSRTNYWPKPLVDNFGIETRIGNSSGTIHAETACLLAAPVTEGARICVTDPFCPNCAKNIAEAGISTIYIDHKGFDKDFAERRGHHFESLSMQIVERAGISVYEIRRKERKIVPILEVPESYKPFNDSPVDMESVAAADEHELRNFVALKRPEHKGRRVAMAIARSSRGKFFGMVARAHPAIGYSWESDGDDIEKMHGQYSLILEPMNRLMMTAARTGMKLISGLIYSSGVPTAREQVNMLGAGLSEIFVADLLNARDEDAFQAMRLLGGKRLIKFEKF